ncbi:MAG: cupin domain-containing protein [Stellaceae bacterium]
MTVAIDISAPDLMRQMGRRVGRHTEKSFDWDAFPASRGFPELARAQMRYIGAGGSPKRDDPGTLAPGRFSLSLIHQPAGAYAACHSHEVVEHFLVLEGVLTIGWMFDDEVIEARLGPLDMVLNQAGRPHGFRNDGVAPVLMSISVGSGMPKPPVYVCHPRDGDGPRARRFGAAPGRTRAFDPASDDLRQREFARHIVRHAEQRPVREAGFARRVYVGEGGAPPGSYRMDMIRLPPGGGVRSYRRAVEDAYFVLEGVLTAGWEESAGSAEERLGPRDVIVNPPGQTHHFRNEGVGDAVFLLLAGTAEPADMRFATR